MTNPYRNDWKCLLGNVGMRVSVADDHVPAEVSRPREEGAGLHYRAKYAACQLRSEVRMKVGFTCSRGVMFHQCITLKQR